MNKRNRNRDREEEEYKEKSIIREVIINLLYIAVVVLITFLMIRFVGQRTQVRGSSMEPTLSNADNLIVDKITYRFKDPERFDIIVFPFDDDTYYIKRIIGLPGETVQVIDGYVYINGELLDEKYGNEVMLRADRAEVPIELGNDEYFVLGDNRNNSTDSRNEKVGNITRKDILGRAWVRIWPLNEFGILKHQ